MISSAKGDWIFSNQINHDTRPKIYLIRSKGGNLVLISSPSLCSKSLIGKFTEQERSIGMCNLSLV